MKIELWEKVIERYNCPSNREVHNTIKSIKKEKTSKRKISLPNFSQRKKNRIKNRL